MQTKKQMLIEAQNEQLVAITKIRLQLRKEIRELTEIGGHDNYQHTLQAIVNDTGPEGILLNEIYEVLPDKELLKEARKELVKAGCITAAESGKTYLLKPVTDVPVAAVAVTEGGDR